MWERAFSREKTRGILFLAFATICVYAKLALIFQNSGELYEEKEVRCENWRTSCTRIALAVTAGAMPKCCVHSSWMRTDKTLTYAVLYHNDEAFLNLQLQHWYSIPKSLQEQLVFMIIDDGSRLHTAHDVLGSSVCQQLDVVLFRIENDIPWNIGGARNLAMSLAPTEYVFLSDIDIGMRKRFVHSLFSLLQYAREAQVRTDVEVIFRKFARDFQDGTTKPRPHPATMLLSKRAYWKVGGCDEDFVGNYGYTDPHFWHRAERTDGVQILNVFETRPSVPALIEFNKSSDNLSIVRDPSVNRKLFETKIRESNWASTYIRFEWNHVNICHVG